MFILARQLLPSVRRDISHVMIAQGLLLPAIVVLGLNIWTTNDTHRPASPILPVFSSRTLSVVNGIIGTVCALWLYNNFVGWLIVPVIGHPTDWRSDYCRLNRRQRRPPNARRLR